MVISYIGLAILRINEYIILINPLCSEGVNGTFPSLGLGYIDFSIKKRSFAPERANELDGKKRCQLFLSLGLKRIIRYGQTRQN